MENKLKMKVYGKFHWLIMAMMVWCFFGHSAAAQSRETEMQQNWLNRFLLADQAAREVKAPLGEQALLVGTVPFSFVYDGRPSVDFLAGWGKTIGQEIRSEGKARCDITWLDPKTNLEIICELTRFNDFPAVEWVLRFTNRGSADSPILEKILPLDLQAALLVGCEPVFHYGHGGPGRMDDFLPLDQKLGEKEIITYPTDKTVSQVYLPYFNLELSGAGICGGIGWTGQWAVDVRRENGRLHMSMGQQLTHLKLHADESIRTPRMLLVFWDGPDRMRGHNLFRRLLLEHYVPRLDGQVVTIPIASQTWPTPAEYATSDKTEIETITKCSGRGVEVHWRDAGWFEGGWPNGAGNWIHDQNLYPNGLKPVSDAAHQAGMKFLLWLEPQRANEGSRIAREYPQWLLMQQEAGWPGWPGNYLFNLGIPEARQWMTDLLSQRFTEYGVDIFRQDHNFNPVMFWRAYDAEDRQGIAEIRHVEGLYAMWDELRRRHPRLIIDNANWRCTGPDFEVMSRSSGSFTRSEFEGCGGNPLANQAATAGLSFYVPLHGNGLYDLSSYALRSVCTTGTNCGFRWQEPVAEQVIAEIKLLRPLCLGDFYPLSAVDVSEESWCAWQFHRPDLGEGVAVIFRRPKTPETSFTVQLKALDASASYDVDFRETYDIRETRQMTGQQLSQLTATLESQPASLLVHYQIRKK